jgi:hypothetical protein
MTNPRLALALFVMVAGVGGAAAQDNKWDTKWDLNRLVPPVSPLPPQSRIDATTLGGAPSPYPNAPLQSPNASSASPAPGLKLTLPSR